MEYCERCGTPRIEGANFCYMCGANLKELDEKRKESQIRGEIPMYSCTLHTSMKEKTIEVWIHDITDFPIKLDLMTISAYHLSYNVNTRTMIGALYQKNGIDTNYYANHAYMDLRDSLGCWLSKPVELTSNNPHIGRLGCIELSGWSTTEEEVLAGIKGYCHFLDLAADIGVKMDTVGMPIVGSGNQKIDYNKILIPLTNEIISMLKRNPNIKKLIFIERDYNKALALTNTLKKSYQMVNEENHVHKTKNNPEPYVFISYSNNGDTQTAQTLCQVLKEKGISYWFAPEAIHSGDYAKQIVTAIDRCTHFICVLSKNSMESFHVLNELNLAFQHMNAGIQILPFRIDEADLLPSFKYYLSTVQWNMGYPPPIEIRVREFLDKIF